MHNLQHIFETHNFELTNETTKGLEYRHQETEDIVYLLPTKEALSDFQHNLNN